MQKVQNFNSLNVSSQKDLSSHAAHIRISQFKLISYSANVYFCLELTAEALVDVVYSYYLIFIEFLMQLHDVIEIILVKPLLPFGLK